MSFIRNIKNQIKLMAINKHIKSVKFVHLMFNDKFNKPYVDFLNENFNQKEHLILCKKIFEQFPFPQGDNVYEIKSYKGLKLENAKNLFFHSLFDNEAIDYLYEHPDILREKSYWLIWGGDLYDAPRNEKNDFVRKNFKGYISSVEGDEKVAKEKYNSAAELHYAAYWGPPVSLKMLENAKNVEKSESIQIQINNSACESTIEMLDILSKFKDENIKIITILSYGNTQFNDEIIKKGKEIFADKFEYIDKYMKPEDYTRLMAKNSVLILNQNRQQGCGNATIAEFFGTKVYVKKDLTTNINLKKQGMSTFDTYEIKNMSFEEFINYDEEEKIKNIKASKEHHKGIFAIKLWENIYGKAITKGNENG